MRKYYVEYTSKIISSRISYYLAGRIEGRCIVLKNDIPGIRMKVANSKCYLISVSRFSKVYVCKSSNGEYYVIKIPKNLDLRNIGNCRTLSNCSVNRSVESLLREIETIKDLSHPCIIRLLDYSLKIPVLLYEYADGFSLKYQLSCGWKPSLIDIVRILFQISHAIKYIHDRDIVHCDLKLSNILICDGLAKICDFNSTKLSYSIMNVSCTRGYCAPEQVDVNLVGRCLSPDVLCKIDIYQLGNIILALLTGRTVDGVDRLKMTDEELMKVVCKIKLKQLRDLVFNMLNVDPTKRPDIEDVLDVLASTYEYVSSAEGDTLHQFAWG